MTNHDAAIAEHTRALYAALRDRDELIRTAILDGRTVFEVAQEHRMWASTIAKIAWREVGADSPTMAWRHVSGVRYSYERKD